jgi:hypothetical protein
LIKIKAASLTLRNARIDEPDGVRTAEAITYCKILVIKRSAVITLAARDDDIARQM